MKKILTALLLTITAVLTVGCHPKDPENGGNGNNNGNGTEPQIYTVSLFANPINGGTVSGEGVFEEGQSCTVKATPAAGYTFSNWTENDTLISTQASYRFTVTANRNLTANFTSNGGDGPIYYTISVTPNPWEGGWTEGGGRYQEGQSCTVTASPDSDLFYIFTNWTENGIIVSEDASYTFTVSYNRHLEANFVIMSACSFIDLGLPSGTLWAACNIGANTPEEYGDYFAWGETEPKNYYSCENYQYCNGCEYNGIYLNTLTKYCNNALFGYNGYTDTLSLLQMKDDAATANWGQGWRIPTKEEWEELLNNTTGQFTSLNDVNGILLTATNGAMLFLPAAGFHGDNSSWYVGNLGNYWACSLDENEPDGAWGLGFTSSEGYMSTSFRFCGRSVRAVYTKPQK